METIVAVAHEYWFLFMAIVVTGIVLTISSGALWFVARPIIGYGDYTYKSAMKGELRTFPKTATIIAGVAFLISAAFLTVALHS